MSVDELQELNGLYARYRNLLQKEPSTWDIEDKCEWDAIFAAVRGRLELE
jgi:hypothetical protein